MINLICGNKISDVKNEVIKSIGDNRLDMSCDNIIVVPDRYSLIVEKSVFEQLHISATFNIHVMGINALTRKLIEQSNLDCVYVDSLSQNFILYRAIQNTKSKFVCFSKNISIGLVEKIKNAISLISSSGVDADELLKSALLQTQSVKNKLTDLAIVYSEYTRLLGGRLDSNQMLKVFSDLIESTTIFENTNFYFCGFDSFTSQGYNIVKKICKIAKNTNIGIVLPSNNKNRYIFDDEMLGLFENYFKQNNLRYQKVYTKPKLNANQQIIFDNVFGYNLKDMGLNSKVAELSTNVQEVEFVAKNIAKMTKNGKKYSNFCIATQKSYFSVIKKIFENYSISCYVDEQKSLKDTPIFNFFKCCLELCCFGYEKENLICFVNNYFCKVDKSCQNDIENFILENNIEFKKVEKLLEKFDVSALKNIFDFCEQTLAKKDVLYYTQRVKLLLEIFDIENKIQVLCQDFENSNQIDLQKIYLQVFDKIQDLVDKMAENLGQEEISILDFVDLFLSSLGDINISSIPLGIDQVFVGDISKSFFEKTEYMFVVGANQDMPTQIKDVGIILDKDIENLKSSISISPTAKIINKRNKFKLFDTLTESENLCVTYPITDQGGKMLPSNFVCDILTLCGNKKITREDFEDDLFFNNPYVSVAKQNVTSSQNCGDVIGALKILGESNDVNFLGRDFVMSGLSMLKGNTTKISQIESYFTCPFKHFVLYGLKLVERKDGKLKANDFGNFLHVFCKIFVNRTKENLGKLDSEQISKITQNVFDFLIKMPKFALFCDEDNDFTAKIVKNEVQRIAEFLNYEQSLSDFKISKTEYGFDGDTLKVNVCGKDYSIVGVVDRIDRCGDHFRIIDYKTGSLASSNSSLTNLYYGTKIQVFVYLKATQNIFKSNAFGAFYLPISNAYSKDSDDDYRMHGYFIDDISLVKKADSTLDQDNLKSKLFEVAFNKDMTSFTRSKNVTKQELEAMVNYAIKCVIVALGEIIEGNTKPSPVDKACEFCELKYICGKNNDLAFRNRDKKVRPSGFVEGKDV